MSQTIPTTPRVIRRMQPWPGNPRVTHLLPFPLCREYHQESSVHGSPLNGAHTHQSPVRRQPLNNAPPPKNKRVVRCFIGAIFGHSQVPGALWGLKIPANKFSLCENVICDSSLEQGLTLLTQLVKLLHPLCRRLYRQLLG